MTFLDSDFLTADGRSHYIEERLYLDFHVVFEMYTSQILPYTVKCWRIKSYLFIQFDCGRHGPSGGQLTELIEAVKDGAVLPHVEPLHLLVVLPHIIGSDWSQEPNVIVRMEFGHFFLSGLVWSVDFHFAVEAIVQKKVMGHAYAMGFHGMALAIVIIANITWNISVKCIILIKRNTDGNERTQLGENQSNFNFMLKCKYLAYLCDSMICCEICSIG